MTATDVWLVLCMPPPNTDEYEETFAFSTYELACEWANQDQRAHVVYSRTIDHPELGDMVSQ